MGVVRGQRGSWKGEKYVVKMKIHYIHVCNSQKNEEEGRKNIVSN